MAQGSPILHPSCFACPPRSTLHPLHWLLRGKSKSNALELAGEWSEGDERGRVLTDLTTVIPCILSVYSLANKQLSNINSQTLKPRDKRLREYCCMLYCHMYGQSHQVSFVPSIIQSVRLLQTFAFDIWVDSGQEKWQNVRLEIMRQQRRGNTGTEIMTETTARRGIIGKW